MSSAIDSLPALRAFVLAAEARSFKVAGQGLGISSSAVGKAISRLEDQLGVTLFKRTTRTMVLTDAGQAFLARTRRVLEEITAAEAELAEASGEPRGRLRVGLPLAGSLFAEALTRFCKAYPQVELDLDYSDRIVDVVDEGFDVVIRTGATGDSRLLRKSLGQFGWGLAASAGYLQRCGTPETPQDLVGHTCIRQKYSSGQIAPWSFRSAPGFRAPISLSGSVIDPLLGLACSGAGIGCFPDFQLCDLIAAGILVPVLEGEINQTGVLTMLWPATRFRAPKVRAFIDTISQKAIL